MMDVDTAFEEFLGLCGDLPPAELISAIAGWQVGFLQGDGEFLTAGQRAYAMDLAQEHRRALEGSLEAV